MAIERMMKLLLLLLKDKVRRQAAADGVHRRVPEPFIIGVEVGIRKSIFFSLLLLVGAQNSKFEKSLNHNRKMSIATASMPLPPHELAVKPRSWLEIGGWSATAGASTFALSLFFMRRRSADFFTAFVGMAGVYFFTPASAVFTGAWLINNDAQREAGALHQLKWDRQWVDSMNTSRARANNP